MPPCEDKMRLLTAYQRLNAADSEAVSNMVVMGIAADALQRLSAIAEEARKAAKSARDRLERHIVQHGC